AARQLDLSDHRPRWKRCVAAGGGTVRRILRDRAVVYRRAAGHCRHSRLDARRGGRNPDISLRSSVVRSALPAMAQIALYLLLPSGETTGVAHTGSLCVCQFAAGAHRTVDLLLLGRAHGMSGTVYLRALALVEIAKRPREGVGRLRM